MGKVLNYIGKQCGNPTGFIGKCMTWGMNFTNRAMYRAIIREANIQKKDQILDIGFGNGFFISKVYKKVKCHIYGIDISPDMVQAAIERNSLGVSKGDIKLSVGDCCELIFENEMFDKITTMNTIYFWSDTTKGMNEIYRTLKKGGTFINAVFEKEMLQKIIYTKNVFHYFSREEYEELGRQAGFTSIEFREVQKGKSFLVIYMK